MVMLVLHSLEKVFESLAIDLLSYGYGMNIFFYPVLLFLFLMRNYYVLSEYYKCVFFLLT